jgi:VWFA-related protein
MFIPLRAVDLSGRKERLNPMLIARSAPNARHVPALLGLAALLTLANPTARAQSAGGGDLRMEAPLVLEDVVVQDTKNQPVHDLQGTDFTITDDGKAVRPQSFEEHTAPTPAELAVQQASLPKIPNLGVNVFTNFAPTPPNSPLNILLLDALNTPMTDQARVRQQMLKYLNDQPAGAHLAIFGLGSRLYLLQGFTTDPAVLKAAIKGKWARIQASDLLSHPVEGSSGSGLYDDGIDGGIDNSELLAAGRDFLESTQTNITTQRVGTTLDALNQLAHYLSVLPGRKNLIWFSAAFPIYIEADLSLENGDGTLAPESMYGSPSKAPFDVAADYGDRVRLTDELLARSQVAIYPVDARGLFDNADVQASGSRGGPSGAIAHCNANCALNGGAVLAQSNTNFQQQIAKEQLTMNEMAFDTGGKAFTNNNDLKSAVESAIAFGSNYYTFSYTPPSGKWDSKYHKIDVKVNQPGLHLSYRRGYYADDPAVDIHGKQHPLPSPMQAAMLHGAPAPSELLFDVRVIPDDGTTDKLAPGSSPDPKLMQPPYRSFTLDTLLDIHFVQMTRASNGEYQGSIEVTVLVYNADGAVVNTKTRIGHFSLPPDRYADLLAHGLPASQSIDIPVKGTYFIRIGVHDPASNHIGAVEIPVAALQSKRAMIAASTRIAPQEP